MQPSAEAAPTTERRQIDLTPDCPVLFNRYVAQIAPTAMALAKRTARGARELEIDARLSLLNDLCFAIAMTAQAMTTEAEVLRFRDVTDKTLTDVHAELERFRATHENDFLVEEQ